MTQREVKIGDVVKSYDFPDRGGACYIVGQVTAIGPRPEMDAPRYTVRVIHRVWLGDIEALKPGEPACVYPPVNGTPTSMGRVCDGVVHMWE